MKVQELKEKLKEGTPETEVEVMFWDGRNANVYNVCGVSCKVENGKVVIFCDKVLR